MTLHSIINLGEGTRWLNEEDPHWPNARCVEIAFSTLQ